MQFEYDPEKSAANLAKHGIDFEHAQALWKDNDRVIGPVESDVEDRWMVVGQIGEKLWSAIISFRGDIIRLISVRRSRPKEVVEYDNSEKN